MMNNLPPYVPNIGVPDQRFFDADTNEIVSIMGGAPPLYTGNPQSVFNNPVLPALASNNAPPPAALSSNLVNTNVSPMPAAPSLPNSRRPMPPMPSAYTVTVDNEKDYQRLIDQLNAPSVSTPAPVTSQRRNNTRVQIPPNQQIGKGERFLRMGTAMLASGGYQGGGLTEGLAAAGGAYADVNQANRTAALAEYERAQEAEKIAMEEQRTRLEKTRKREQEARSVGYESAKLENLYSTLKKAGDNVTGPIQGTFNDYLDRMSSTYGDAAIADLRNQLKEYKVDETLKRIALTKGAVSDREMAIFESPFPKMTDTEEVWLLNIDRKRKIAQKIYERMLNDMQVEPDYEPDYLPSNSMVQTQGTQQQSTQPNLLPLSSEDEALFENIP